MLSHTYDPFLSNRCGYPVQTLGGQPSIPLGKPRSNPNPRCHTTEPFVATTFVLSRGKLWIANHQATVQVNVARSSKSASGGSMVVKNSRLADNKRGRLG